MSAAQGKPGGGWRNQPHIRAILDAPVVKPPRLPAAPLRVAEDVSWMGSALCAQVDLDLPYPGKGHYESVVIAKQVCAGCEVRAQCLAYALKHHEDQGVWGGLSVNERRRLQNVDRRFGPKPIHHGTESGYRAHYRHGEQPCGACHEAEAAARHRRTA